MVCLLKHLLSPSTASLLPGACVPATAGADAELLVRTRYSSSSTVPGMYMISAVRRAFLFIY